MNKRQRKKLFFKRIAKYEKKPLNPEIINKLGWSLKQT